MGIFEQNLDRTPANYVPLSPVSFLTRTVGIYPNRVAVIHGDRRYTYGQFSERARRLASSLARAGVGRGDAAHRCVKAEPRDPRSVGAGLVGLGLFAGV